MKNFRNEFFYSRISKRNNSKYSLRSLQFSIGKESTMNSKQNFFVTENPKRLRDSLIWDLQKNFYVEKGPSCWTEGIVPNFVTSNSFIAKQYATCILGYLRDYYLKYGFSLVSSICRPNANNNEPIYILEIGSGHGKLGFLIIKHLLSLKQFWPKCMCLEELVTSRCREAIRVCDQRLHRQVGFLL